MHALIILQAGADPLLTGRLLALLATSLVAGGAAFIFWRRTRQLRRDLARERAAARATARTLMNTVPEPVFIHELETGRFLDVNDAVVERIGYTRDEIIGATPALLSDPARVDIAQGYESFRRAAEGTPQVFSWWARSKDGAAIAEEVALRRGEYLGRPVVYAVARDVTRRVEAEESVRLQAQEYRELFEADLVGNFVGRPDGSLEACNMAFCRIAGYASVEAALEGGIPRLDVGRRHALLQLLREQGRLEGLEVEIHRRDGRAIRILLYARGVFEAGELTRFHGHCLDVTEQKALAERARDAQKMEAVGLLAGGVAHDFNNALTTVQGHAELLLEEAGPDSPFRTGLEEIRRSAERAGRLTRKLLTFSRRRVLRPRLIHLSGLVRETRALLEQLLDEEIVLRLDLTEEPDSIRAEPGEMEQLLINLVLNAREAIPATGHVTIRTRPCGVPGCPDADDRLEPGRYILLEVEDDGVGMSEPVRARAFEPFFSTKPEAQGRGLGLATVYGIIRDVGGAAWVRSAPGEGTTVKICIPLEDQARAAAPAGEAPKPAVDVLLAEDEDGVRRLARRVLEKAGLRVHEAASGDEALALAMSLGRPVGLLVTDVVMPGLRGTELAARLQAIYPGLRVLFMSGYTEADQLRDDALAPGEAFLAKPFTPADLRESVAELVVAPVPAGGQE